MRYAYQAYKTGNSDVGRIRRQPHPAKGEPNAAQLAARNYSSCNLRAAFLNESIPLVDSLFSPYG